ncbi:MAG: hypothetical protein GW938_15115 [Leptospira sp.]|nr:hypothetical protein [Leptospira sp.]
MKNFKLFTKLSIKPISFFFIFFYIVYFYSIQFKNYNRYIKFYKTDLTSFQHLVRNPMLILNEFNSLLKNQNNIEGRIFVIPEKLSSSVGIIDLLVQYSFTQYNYEILESFPQKEDLSKIQSNYLILNKKNEINSDIKFKLIEQTSNYKLLELIQ